MIKNVFLKNLLINTVFRGISCLNACIKKDDKQILLYSDLGLRDNLKYLYDYLVKEGYDRNYHIFVAANGCEKEAELNKRVTFISKTQGVLRFLKAGHVYYCFGKLPIVPGRGQTVCQMWHGTSFKGFAKNQIDSTKKDKLHQFYTHVFASSEYFVPIVKEKFGVPESVVCVAGHPRTDVMVDNRDVNCYGLSNNSSSSIQDKVVLLLPTFRKSEKMGMADGDSNRLVPIFDKDDFSELDKQLKELHIKLIIKLHPMQDVSGETIDYQNLQFLSNAEFARRGYDLYKLLSDADALVTDYSSVFYDYLLLDRPIGFTEDDVEQYKDTRGFAVDPEKFRPGMRIRNKNDMAQFLQSIADGMDEYKGEREGICKLSNAYLDSGNCRRALELCNIRK